MGVDHGEGVVQKCYVPDEDAYELFCFKLPRLRDTPSGALSEDIRSCEWDVTHNRTTERFVSEIEFGL